MSEEGLNTVSKGNLPSGERALDVRQIIGLIVLALFGIITLIGINDRSLYLNISQLLMSSFYLGALYLCLSLGLTLTYKIVGFANFAHAEYFLVGAYVGVAWTIYVPFEQAQRYHILVVLILAFFAAGLVALLSDLLVFEPLRKKNSSSETLMISSIGVGIIIRNVVSLFFGGDSQYFRWINLDPTPVPSLRFGARKELISFSPYKLPIEYQLTIYVSIILVGSMIFMLQFSKAGKALRATADNPDLAESSGIDTKRMIRLVWIIGGGLAGVAGVLFAVSFPVIPYTGFLFLLPAFAVVVFGGVGSLKGSILASFFIAVAQNFSVTYLTGLEGVLSDLGIERSGLSAYQRIIPFVVIIFVLFLKPQGLYGEDEETSSTSMKYIVMTLTIIFVYYLIVSNWIVQGLFAAIPGLKVLIDYFNNSLIVYFVITIPLLVLLTYLIRWISDNSQRMMDALDTFMKSPIIVNISSEIAYIFGKISSFISLIYRTIRYELLGTIYSDSVKWINNLRTDVQNQSKQYSQKLSNNRIFFGLISTSLLFDAILLFYSFATGESYDPFIMELLILVVLITIGITYYQKNDTTPPLVNASLVLISTIVFELINSFSYTIPLSLRILYVIIASVVLLNEKVGMSKILLFNLIIALLCIPSSFSLYFNDELIDGFFLLVYVLLSLLWIYRAKDQSLKTSNMNNLRLIATFFNYFTIISIFLATGRAVFFREVIIFTAFYGILAISLNMSTGIVGVLNFGVIAQVAVGAVVVGIASVNGVNIFLATILAMIITAIFSAFLAISTVRLRDDYFAIVSITIGEIFRQFLNTEPLLRAVSGVEKSTTPGILDIPQPFSDIINPLISGTILEEFSYRLFLGFFGIGLLILTFTFAYILFNSPWGRVLRSIREDEEVVENYGKNVLAHKVIIMTISGAIAGLGGAYMAWVFQSLFPNNFQPLITFYVWTAFIIGGRGNNKGMIAGSMIFVLMLRTSRFVDDPNNAFFRSVNNFVTWVNPDLNSITLSYIQLIVVGLILILFLRYASRGVLAEEPYEPDIGDIRLPDRGSQADSRHDLEVET